MKSSSYELGKLAEELALEWLYTRGFTLCRKNYRIPGGEIDLIMESTVLPAGETKSPKTLHFIEVKSSKTLDLDSIDQLFHQKKKMHVLKTARHFLRNFPEYFEYTIQFDLLFIDTSNRQITFFEDVITPENYGI